MENAHFTELTEHNPKVLALLSPKGLSVANAVKSQLQVWNVESKKTSHRFECDCFIDFIKWSPDSELICCGKLKGCIQAWNLNLPHWRLKISGCLGFANIHWAPDSQHLLVISEFHIKVTIFSLVSAVVAEIDNPKAIESGIIFSPCEKYLVIAQRLNCEDFLGVYSLDTWEAIKIFPVETKNLASITFSTTDFVVAILDSSVEYKVLFYSIDGRLLRMYVDEAGFGLISLSWSFSKNLVAVGDFLGEVKILDYFSCQLLTSYQHPEVIESTDITLYKVNDKLPEIKSPQAEAFTPYFELDEVIKSRPVPLVVSSSDGERGKDKNPLKAGVQTLQFSNNGKFIATVNGNMPKLAFVYDVENCKLRDVIIRGTNIKSICWHPKKPFLIICSSCNVLDMWTPVCCIRYLPSFVNDFPINNAVWSSNGDYVLLNSRNHFSVLFFT